MAEETPREKYERLQRAIQSEILTSYPNPTRKGCPSEAVVREVAERKELITDEPWEHITHCSPCYREFLDYKDGFRKREAKRKRLFRYQLVAAACLLLTVAIMPFVWNRFNNDRVFDAELNLRHRLIFRGPGNPEDQPTPLNPPLTLRRGHLRLKIDLPETWPPGRYDVAFLSEPGKATVFAATANAALQDGSAIVQIDARLNVSPGDYTISLRRQGSGWTGYPVKVTDASKQ